MAPPSVRALRVGVLLGGNLVEERVLRGATPITFGQSLRCTLSIPGDGVPLEHVLFVRDQERVQLRVTAKMEGRISHGDVIRTELRDGVAAQGVWTIPLERGARGKLRIGDATVLFQEIAAPPLAPRPQLPASIRGTLADRVDRRLAVIIGGSILAHLGIAGWAWITDTDRGALLSPTVSQTYHQETMEVTLPELDSPITPPATEPGPGTAIPVSPVQIPAPIIRKPNPHTTAFDPARVVDDATRMAQILTGSDPGRTGPGEMHGRQPGADLDSQLADIRDGNHRVTIGDDGHAFRDRPGTPRLGTNAAPITRDPNQLTPLPGHRDDEPGGRIVIKPVPGDGPGTTLSVDAVLAKINGAYMSGLQRCYKKGLRGDSTLSGKVAMSFTVTETGRLEDATAHGVSAEVDACISSLMIGWRFPIPKDKQGDTVDASFKLGLALQPSS